MTAQARRPLLLLTVFALLLALLPSAAGAADNDPAPEKVNPPPVATSFNYFKYADPACSLAETAHGTDTFTREDCGYGEFVTDNTTADSRLQVRFLDPNSGEPFHNEDLENTGENGSYTFDVNPEDNWPAGVIDVEVVIDGEAAGVSSFKHNHLGAEVIVPVKEGEEGPQPYRPGDAIDVSGTVYQEDTNTLTGGSTETGVPAEFTLRVTDAGGEELGTVGPQTAGEDGTFTATIPARITNKVEAGFRTDFLTTIAITVTDASYEDPATGAWAADDAGVGAAQFFVQPEELVLQSRYVSSTGWVKPGETFPFRVLVHNFTEDAASDLRVTIPAPPSVRFVDVTTRRGTASVNDNGNIVWTMGSLDAAKGGEPTTAELIVNAKAFTLKRDPEIVWKNLSSTARLRYDGGPRLTSETHGPKVIPADDAFNTARYGDKPFPMVPVEYQDREHQPEHQGEDLDRVVNDPTFEGSTFNLYQEMSYGQLFPEGTVPSSGIASANFSDYEQGFDFSTYQPSSSNAPCRGFTAAQVPGAVGSPAYNQRIVDGWYQLPGTTEYYGGDFPAFTLGLAGSIDSACGQLGKVTYDAAAIADPEINYNEYDSDKDGVVDFFMTVFVGCGGNGASQVPALCEYPDAPYDNVWPHSSDLQMQFRDEETGLRGYISDDQLEDLEGDPQCYTNESRGDFVDCSSPEGKEDLPVFVRVGPYNVNPESSFDSASVISHEYGHHLGLPDFYSSDSLYADMNLMAADYSQHMTIFSKQELGWVVPRFLQPGEVRKIDNWDEIKSDTGKIHWYRPDGTKYVLSAANGDANIHNGESWSLKLPQRILIEPDVVEEGASLSHVWYSGRGNDFGCAPDAGHNLDVYLPELSDVPEGSNISLTFKSSWDIEWDWDYGFVMTSGDGATYTSHPSENGYTTENTYNPNSQQCQTQHNNGLTGQSGAYQAGEAEVVKSRNPAANEYDDGAPFLEDSYDISDLAGTENPVLRFSYFTDAAFDRPGWFIDDVEVRVDDEVVYSSNFEEDAERDRLYPGGCAERLRVAEVCTDGWTRVNAELPAAQDHAYYMELRDQSGFDYDGHGQSDRGDTSWDPGLLLEYTDEVHGYGNNGVPLPPPQHYLDSQPIPGEDCGDETDGNCADASFTDADGDSRFSDAKTVNQPLGWIDNFTDDRNEETCVENCDSGEPVMVHPWLFDYNCLTMNVRSMTGERIGPEPLPSDLKAAVTLRAGDGCRGYDYGGALELEPPQPNLACPPDMLPPIPFTDVTNSVHRANINCIAWYTITVGAAEGEYDPGSSVTRGQMASFIARLAIEAGVIDSLDADFADAFGDDDDHTHEVAINALADAGLISGTAPDAFSPNKRVSRAQMASFIANLHRAAVDGVNEPDKDYFTDDNSSVHESNINLLASLNVVKGVGNNKYAPARNVSREQMATFIAADLGQLVARGAAYMGGAGVTLDAVSADAGSSISGTLLTNKTLKSFTASGCGNGGEDVAVADDGTFSVPVEGDSGTKCSLELTAKTTRAAGDDEREQQTAVYEFVIRVN